jgi:hypothetical protein
MQARPVTAATRQINALNARCIAFGRACRNQSILANLSMIVASVSLPAALACSLLGDSDLLAGVVWSCVALLVLGVGLAVAAAHRRDRLYRDIKARAARLSRDGFSVYKHADRPLLGAFRRGNPPAGRLVLQLEKLSAPEFDSLLFGGSWRRSIDPLSPGEAVESRALETIAAP